MSILTIIGTVAAIVILTFVAMQYRAKRVEAQGEGLDPYEGYELTKEELDYLVELNCPWACGECHWCKQGREPDQG
jgi:hypothetical protein